MSNAVVHSNPWFSISLSETGGQRWFRVQRPDSAMLVGRTAHGHLLLVEGTRDTTGDGTYLEFPCGAIDTGESPEDAAKRETREETGFSASSLVRIGSFVESPGISGSTCHVFSAVIDGTHEPELEPGEDWSVVLLTVDELWGAVRAGRVVDGGTLAALALLGTDS